MSWRGLLSEIKWLMLIPLVDSIYLLLNHETERVYSLVTILDEKIPFLPFFIIPYLAWYGILFVALIWFAFIDKQLYKSSIISILCGLLMSFIIFSTFQTTVPRPYILEHNLYSQLTLWIYSIDNPYNAFPSIHVFTCYVIFIGCLKVKNNFPKTSIILLFLVILVILSTVFLKQHTLLDVLGGIALGYILSKAMYWYESYFSKERVKPSNELAISQGENEPLEQI